MRALVLLVGSCVAALRVPTALPRGVLGPPAHFDGLQGASQFLSVSRECSVDASAQIDFEVVRLASRPACFQACGMLSPAECEHLIRAADAAGMEQATTAGGDARSGCGVAWLDVASDDTAAAISGAVEQLFLRPELLEPSEWSGGGRFENLQVLRYATDGEFKLHYDANQQTHPTNAIPDGWEGMDIGPESRADFAAALAGCKTILWNGPMGVFEFDRFAEGLVAFCGAGVRFEGARHLVGVDAHPCRSGRLSSDLATSTLTPTAPGGCRPTLRPRSTLTPTAPGGCRPTLRPRRVQLPLRVVGVGVCGAA